MDIVKEHKIIRIANVVVILALTSYLLEWALNRWIPASFLVAFRSYIVLSVFLFNFFILKTAKIQEKLFINFFLACFLICFLACFLEDRRYEQWRFVFTSFFPILILPCTAILSTYIIAQKRIINLLFKFGLPLSLLPFYHNSIGILKSTDYFGHVVIFVCLFILFIPYISRKSALIVIAFSIISFFSDLGSRFNIINILGAYGILLLYYLSSTFKNIYSKARLVLLILPIILLYLGVAGLFNIFKVGEKSDELEFKIENGEVIQMSGDSRSFLYQGMIKDLTKNNAILFGKSAAGMTDSKLANIKDKQTGKMLKGRMGCEVGILTYFSWGGLLFVFVYFLLAFKASFFAVKKSENKLVKMIGVWVAFHWLAIFIEGNPIFDIYCLTIWVAIGMCLSTSLSMKTDKEIRNLFHDEFYFKN